MGASYAAYTVIGSLINESDLYRVEHVDVHQGCESKGGGKKFCPDCGRSAVETEKEITPIEGFDETDDPEDWNLNGLSILSVGWGMEKTHFVVATLCSVGGEEIYDEAYTYGNARRLHNVDLAECQERVKTALEPVGLWDLSKFGIWTALYGGG